MIDNHEVPYNGPIEGKEICYLKASETAINRESHSAEIITNRKPPTFFGSYLAKSQENNMSNPGTESLPNEVSNNLSDDY